MRMENVYCASTLGGTSRGVGVLRALGGGVLVTPFRDVPEAEPGIEFFGHVPLSCRTLILDKMKPRQRGGNYGKVLIYGEDLEPGPVLPRQANELELDRAEEWWERPPPIRVKAGGLWYDVEPHYDRRVLCVCSSWRPRDWREFEEQAQGRVVLPSPRLFYWPAMELMVFADEVQGGGEQVLAERVAAKTLDFDNQARRVAADVKRAVDRSWSFG